MIAIADSLNTKVEYVDVFSVLDSESAPGFVDVRFTAHGSPYYNTTKLIGAVLADGNVSSRCWNARVIFIITLIKVGCNFCYSRISVYMRISNLYCHDEI